MTLRMLILVAASTFCGSFALSQEISNATVIEAAEALGMIRSAARRMDSINTVEFSGRGMIRRPQDDGTWWEAELTNLTVGISYSIPALRWDQTTGDERVIYVVRGDEAWEERTPGVGKTPAMHFVDRFTRQIWFSPHGLIRAAIEAEVQDPGSVEIESNAGRSMLTVEVDGFTLTATLDDNNRPQSVSMPVVHPLLGPTTLSTHYSDYIDWPLLDVFFPSHIEQTLGDVAWLELEVTEFFQNPYVVFPDPLP